MEIEVGGVEQLQANVHNRIDMKPVESIPDYTAISLITGLVGALKTERQKWVLRPGGTEALAECNRFCLLAPLHRKSLRRDEI
jgi:hypothetical protein